MKKAFLLALVILAAPTAADAAGGALRSVVGVPLQQAVALANARNFSAAEAKIKQAESVSNKTDIELAAIADLKRFVEAKRRN